MSIKQDMGELFLQHSRLECGTPDRLQIRSGQTKGYDIGNYCFSTKNAALRSKKKTDWLKIRIMCPNGATYLPATVVYFAYFFLTLFWVRVHMTTYRAWTDLI